MSARVTIIIPAYNAAGRIARTLDSVLAQTLQEIYVWVVDDGSTDATAEIVSGYARRDSRIRLFRQQNQGAYAARLTAWRETTTEYVGFVDADDTIEPDMYARMVEFADAHALELVQCDQQGDARVGAPPELFLGRDVVLEKVIVPRLIRGEGAVCVWDKLYRRGGHDISRFIHSSILMGEDLAINLQYFVGLSRIGYLHLPLYHYDVNAGSSVKNFRKKSISDFREIVRFRNLLGPQYGYEPEHPFMRGWILKNLTNALWSALRAPVPNLGGRVENVRALLAIPEVAEALLAGGGIRAHVSKLLIRCFRLAPSMSVPLARLVLRMVR